MVVYSIFCFGMFFFHSAVSIQMNEFKFINALYQQLSEMILNDKIQLPMLNAQCTDGIKYQNWKKRERELIIITGCEFKMVNYMQ